jgi:hypothetical protein
LTRAKNRTLAPVAKWFLERLRKIVAPMRSVSAQQLQRALRNRPSKPKT